MNNITSKIDCFYASYYGYEHSFHQDYWKQDWSDRFCSLEDALQYISNEDCGEISIDEFTIYEDGEFTVPEEKIIRLVKEAEASHIRWLQKELDRMIK